MMIRTLSFSALLVALAAFPLAGSSGAELTTVGNAATVVKTVTGQLESAEDKREIQMLDDLYHNELIETGPESATEIVFLDDTQLAIGANSVLVLDRFVYDPDPSRASFVITATQGVFRFATGSLPKKSYEINTPGATIGIRGTEFDLVVSRGGDGKAMVAISLRHGEAIISDCSGHVTRLMHEGELAVVEKQGANSCQTSVLESY